MNIQHFIEVIDRFDSFILRDVNRNRTAYIRQCGVGAFCVASANEKMESKNQKLVSSEYIELNGSLDQRQLNRECHSIKMLAFISSVSRVHLPPAHT